MCMCIVKTEILKTQFYKHSIYIYILLATNTIRNNQQVLKTTAFTSTQTKETCTIFHKVTCYSNYVIYLLECIMSKIQYVGKSETSFNIRVNNHRKDIKNPNTVEACKHFNNNGHTFSKHGKFYNN